MARRAVAPTPKPAEFHDRAVVPAKAAGAPYNPPANRAVAHQPAANTPVAHPGNNAARPDRPAQPNNRPEANRPAVAQPNNRPAANRPPAPQPSNRPEANR